MTKEEKNYYLKAWRQSHKEYFKDYRKSHQEECRAYYRKYNQEHIEERKAWRESHQEEYRDYNRNYQKAYHKMDINSSGQTKNSIRTKSNRYLSKYGTKIPGYEIHHCFGYNEPLPFIYCSKETHLQIHAFLRNNKISADSNHYEQIKHLLDDTVVFYGIREGVNDDKPNQAN